MDQIVTSPSFCSCFPKIRFMSERAIKCDTKIDRPIVVFQPFPIYNYVQLNIG